MPELPEVETVVRFLRSYLEGLTIRRVKHADNFPKVLSGYSHNDFNRLVVNQMIHRVWRRGKYIVLDLSQGHLLIHLRMTGRLMMKLSESDNSKYVTAMIDFNNGKSLYLHDYRKFGRFFYYATLDPLEEKLGVEPLSDEFTVEWIKQKLKVHQRQMKPLLLNQSFIAGLGNIYVDESLWSAKIHPKTISRRVSGQKVRALYSAIQYILTEAITMQGTTIINFQFGDGETGRFKELLQVFGRAGESCPRCKNKIKKIKVAQRGTYFCPRCQRVCS